MELRILRSFLAVAKAQSISGAARALYISQPSISRQILDLEEELGVKLFERGNRKILLTEEGVLLRKRAEQITDLIIKTEEELKSQSNTIVGTIRIGAGETHSLKTLAKAIKTLSDEYSEIRFNIFSGNAEDVMDKLDKGLVDFGVLIEPYDVPKYDYINLPIKDRWGVLMLKDNKLARYQAITPSLLQKEPLICSAQAVKKGQLSSWLKVDYTKLNVVASYNLLYNASLLAETGLGYVLCLENILNTSGDSKLCFRPLEPTLKSQVNLVWNKQQVFSKASELFLEQVRKKVFDISIP